jgi:hypothetical protein
LAQLFGWQGQRKNKSCISQIYSSRNQPTTTGDAESASSELTAIRHQLSHLSSRVDRQDSRIDNIEGTITAQHNEVMNMLRGLSLGNSSSANSQPPSKPKRSPQTQSTPLKAAVGGRQAKEQRLALPDDDDDGF